jgi:catechol 2,3-dioxygenase-like lactoylglutathione lyase family enzyme
VTIRAKFLCPLIQVFDMPTSLAFYRDKLGFEIVSDTGESGDAVDWALLRLGEAWLMLNTRYEADGRPEAPDPAQVSAHDDTGLFFTCASADEAYDHLSAQGLIVDPPRTQGYGMRQVYVHDPDGYNLCFQHEAA